MRAKTLFSIRYYSDPLIRSVKILRSFLIVSNRLNVRVFSKNGRKRLVEHSSLERM